MTSEQEVKRDLIKEFILSNLDGPWLKHFRDMLQPIMYPAGSPTVEFGRAIEILYAKIERNEFA